MIKRFTKKSLTQKEHESLVKKKYSLESGDSKFLTFYLTLLILNNSCGK
jgi:hypothetical protein